MLFRSFVTGRNKGIIEDHFDKQFELEATLEQRGKTAELEALQKDLPEAGQATFTRQQEPLGLGHAVWCARDIVGDEPFAVLLPDMLIHSKKSCLAQMIEAYETSGSANLVAVEEVLPEDTGKYGIVGRGEARGPAFDITEMVEKQIGRASCRERVVRLG